MILGLLCINRSMSMGSCVLSCSSVFLILVLRSGSGSQVAALGCTRGKLWRNSWQLELAGGRRVALHQNLCPWETEFWAAVAKLGANGRN